MHQGEPGTWCNIPFSLWPRLCQSQMMLRQRQKRTHAHSATQGCTHIMLKLEFNRCRAAYSGDVEGLNKVLNGPDGYVRAAAPDRYGRTALHFCAQNNDFRMVQMLTFRMKDWNDRNRYSTPFGCPHLYIARISVCLEG